MPGAKFGMHAAVYRCVRTDLASDVRSVHASASSDTSYDTFWPTPAYTLQMDVTDMAALQNGVVSAQDQAALDRWDALLTETNTASQYEDAEEEDSA